MDACTQFFTQREGLGNVGIPICLARYPIFT